MYNMYIHITYSLRVYHAKIIQSSCSKQENLFYKLRMHAFAFNREIREILKCGAQFKKLATNSRPTNSVNKVEHGRSRSLILSTVNYDTC